MNYFSVFILIFTISQLCHINFSHPESEFITYYPLDRNIKNYLYYNENQLKSYDGLYEQNIDFEGCSNRDNEIGKCACFNSTSNSNLSFIQFDKAIIDQTKDFLIDFWVYFYDNQTDQTIFSAINDISNQTVFEINTKYIIMKGLNASQDIFQKIYPQNWSHLLIYCYKNISIQNFYIDIYINGNKDFTYSIITQIGFNLQQINNFHLIFGHKINIGVQSNFSLLDLNLSIDFQQRFKGCIDELHILSFSTGGDTENQLMFTNNFQDCALQIDNQKCQFCKYGFEISQINQTMCNPRCLNSSFYNNINKCEPCHQNCLSCYGNGEDECYQCKEQKGLHQKIYCLSWYQQQYEFFLNHVQNSDIQCQSCISSANNCSKCSSIYFYQLDLSSSIPVGFQCLLNCYNGFYKNTYNKSCSECNIACKTCIGPTNNKCLECSLGFQNTINQSQQFNTDEEQVSKGNRQLSQEITCTLVSELEWYLLHIFCKKNFFSDNSCEFCSTNSLNCTQCKNSTYKLVNISSNENRCYFDYQIEFTLEKNVSNPLQIFIDVYRLSQNINNKSDLSQFFKIDIEGYDSSLYNYSIKQIDEANQLYSIDLQFNKSITEGPKLTVQTQKQNRSSINNFQAKTNLNEYDIGEYGLEQSLMTAATLGAFANVLAGGSGASKSVTMLGLIELLKFQNIQYPNKTLKIFENIQPFPPNFVVKLIFGGNLTKYSSFFEENTTDIQKLPAKFISYELSPYFLNNQLEPIGQIIIFIIIGFIFIGIQTIVEKSRRRNVNYDQYSIKFNFFNWIFKFVVWNLVIILTIGHYMMFCVSSNIEVIIRPITGGTKAIINLVFGIVFLFLNMFFIFHLFMLVKTADRIEWYYCIINLKFHRERKQINTENKGKTQKQYKKLEKSITKQITKKENATNYDYQLKKGIWNGIQKLYYPSSEDKKDQFLMRYLFLYGDYKDNKTLQRYFNILDISRIFLVSAIICLLRNSPFMASGINLIILLAYFILYTYYLPYKDFYMFIILQAIEMIILIDYFCAFLLALDDAYGLVSKSIRKSMGNAMSFGAMCIGFLASLFLLLTIIRLIKDIIRNYLNKNKEKQKEYNDNQPENIESNNYYEQSQNADKQDYDQGINELNGDITYPQNNSYYEDEQYYE